MKKGAFFILASIIITSLFLPGCGGSNGNDEGTLNIIAGINADGMATLAVVTVYEDGFFLFGTPVENAIVTINGTSITHSMMGMYQGDLTGLVSSGDTLSLTVQYGGTTYTASVTMPHQPVVNDPAPFDETQNQTISWSIAVASQMYDIGIDDTYTAGSGDYEESEFGTETTHQIPLNTVGSSLSNVEITVDAVNSATIQGADAFSAFAASFTGTSPQFNT
jgi:hypothetical protein